MARSSKITEANLAAGWIAQYVGETDPALRAKPKEAELEEGRRRRRIEDILEASRLEREALTEVWE